MLILLPPSETKRVGGRGRTLDVDSFPFASLRPEREASIDALIHLAGDAERSRRVLKLGATQLADATVNLALRTAPTLPAVDRYTGVLYDALDAASLDAASRRWLGSHVMIHSAPFGPVGALDAIPAYRLGAAASVPGLLPLRRLWAGPVTAAIAAAAPTFVLDLRSEAYVALGPLPASARGAYVRVVTETATGEVRALNHFNKHAKGALVRALATTRPRVATAGGLLRWADAAGWQLRPSDSGERALTLTVHA